MAPQRTIKNILSFIFGTSASCVAFVPDDNGVQWAVIQESSKGPILRGFGFDPSAKEALAHVQGTAKDTIYLASVLPSVTTLCRQVCLPPLASKEVLPALKDTLEQTLSVKIAESSIAYESHQNEDGSLTVTTYLAQQKQIQDHLSYINSLSIDPEWLLPKAACLTAFLAHFAMQGWHCVIDINAHETTIVLIFNGHVIESRSLVGGHSAFVGLEEPSPENDDVLRRFLQHINEALLAYKERYGVEEGFPLTVTGSVLSFELAATVISEFVRIPLSQLHSIPDNTSLLQCAAAIGAAFLSQPTSANSNLPNFRTDEFACTHPFMHWKRPLIALGVGCLALSSAIVWYGSSRSAMTVEQMRLDWKAITEAAHTTHEELSKQTEQSLGSRYELESSSPEHLLAMGNWLLSSIERQTSYPLHPDIPRLTHVITWLSSLISDIEKSNPLSNEKFEIQLLSYQLVKHPTKNHPKERYQVRVDIECVTSSIAFARAFHDRLIAPNQYVDTSSEVKWTPSNGKYRVTFFLKDKTHYPPQNP